MNQEPNYNRADKLMAEALDNVGKDDSREIVLSTGVVLRAKPANPSTLIRAMSKDKRPTPPVHFIKNMGREIENPDDPDYISRVQAWKLEFSNSMLNVLIATGTEIVSVPNGIEGPHPVNQEPPKWIEDYRLLGFDVFPDSPTWRYMIWVLFIAAPTQEDIQVIQKKVSALSGVKEVDVREAESFSSSD